MVGVIRLGGLPGLPGRVILSAGMAICHVNVSRWGNPPSRGGVHVTKKIKRANDHKRLTHQVVGENLREK